MEQRCVAVAFNGVWEWLDRAHAQARDMAAKLANAAPRLSPQHACACRFFQFADELGQRLVNPGATSKFSSSMKDLHLAGVPQLGTLPGRAPTASNNQVG